jgi:NAD(P)-dependent dehydrogenase (short-subunit alcohol dehydrogenase family)
MIHPGLEGRVVLITGANHGIGASGAAVLAALGATTGRHVLDCRDHEALGRAIVRVNPSSGLLRHNLEVLR